MAASEIPVFRRMAKLAWRNVTRNWRHGLATTLAIATGFMAISVFDGFILELVNKTNDGYASKGMLGHVIIQRKDAMSHLQEDPWQYSLNLEEQRFLEEFFASDSAFDRRVRFLNLLGMISSGENNAIFTGFGYDLKEGAKIRGERWSWNTTAGKPLYLSPPHSIVLGGKLGETLGCVSNFEGKFILPDGNFIPAERPLHCKDERVMLSATTEAAQVNAIGLNVTGLFDAGFREANKRAIYLSLDDAQRLLDTDKITMVSVRLKSDSEVDSFIARLQAAAKQRNFALDVMPWLEHSVASYARGGLELLGVFRNLFMVIVVIISVMAVANTMMKSVNERIQEIGTLRSLGYLRHHIVFIFACEGLFVSLIACLVGLLLTIGVSHLVGTLGITYKAGVLSLPLMLRVAYAPVAWFWSGLLLTLLATGTAWICARKASRMVIAEAVHHA